MIYSTNRTSLGDTISVDVNESYFGIGAQSFMEESAQDELAIFESAIKSDIDEAIIGESADELKALNEGFVGNAVNKIKEIFKKFIAWCQAVTRSAFAKLSQLLVRDNAKFAKIARKHIATMKNKDKFKYSGKVVKNANATLAILKSLNTDVESEIKSLSDVKGMNVSTAESNIKNLKDMREEFTVASVMKECSEEVTDAGFSIVADHLTVLDSLAKKDVKEVKTALNKLVKAADKASKDVSKVKEGDDVSKEQIDAASKLASEFSAASKHLLSVVMSVIKGIAKIARGVVAKAMGATPKNEGYEIDEELNDALIEAVEWDYDEALEEMSEAKDCDDDDLEDLDAE